MTIRKALRWVHRNRSFLLGAAAAYGSEALMWSILGCRGGAFASVVAAVLACGVVVVAVIAATTSD